MKNNTITINGITVPRVNMCTVQHRTPDPVKPVIHKRPKLEKFCGNKLTMECQAMIKNWTPDRIRQYLGGISEAESAKYKAELNKLKGECNEK